MEKHKEIEIIRKKHKEIEIIWKKKQEMETESGKMNGKGKRKGGRNKWRKKGK